MMDKEEEMLEHFNKGMLILQVNCYDSLILVFCFVDLALKHSGFY